MMPCLAALVSPIYPFNFDVLIAILSITAMSGPGTLLRVELQRVALDWDFSIPSLLTNLCGCFIMGFHEGFARSHWVSRTFEDKYVKVGIATGFAGSVTTFSSFNFEVCTLLISYDPAVGLYFAAIANTFIGGILLYFVGEFIASFIFKRKEAEDQNQTIPSDATPRDQDLSEHQPNGAEMAGMTKHKHSLNETLSLSEIECDSDQSDDSESDDPSKMKVVERPQSKYNEDYCILIQWTIALVVTSCMRECCCLQLGHC